MVGRCEQVTPAALGFGPDRAVRPGVLGRGRRQSPRGVGPGAVWGAAGPESQMAGLVCRGGHAESAGPTAEKPAIGEGEWTGVRHGPCQPRPPGGAGRSSRRRRPRELPGSGSGCAACLTEWIAIKAGGSGIWLAWPCERPPGKGRQPAVQRPAAARRKVGTDAAFSALVGGTDGRLGTEGESACRSEGRSRPAPRRPFLPARRTGPGGCAPDMVPGHPRPARRARHAAAPCQAVIIRQLPGCVFRSVWMGRLRRPYGGPRRLLLSPRVSGTRACKAPQRVGEGRRDTGHRPRKKPTREGAGLSPGRPRASMLRRATRDPCARPRPGLPGGARTGADDGGHLPIIAPTARSRKEDREGCLAAGMDDFLAKPIPAAELWAAMGRVVGTRPPADPPRLRLLEPQVILAAGGATRQFWRRFVRPSRLACRTI